MDWNIEGPSMLRNDSSYEAFEHIGPVLAPSCDGSRIDDFMKVGCTLCCASAKVSESGLVGTVSEGFW